MPASRLVGFALIWAALALLTFDSLRTRRSARRAPDPGPESVEILA